MQVPPNPKHESDSIKNAFIATSVVLYMQSWHLQQEDDTDAVMLSFLLANAHANKPENTGEGGAGNSHSGGAGNSGDDDDMDDRNLGSSTVNNVGQVSSDADFIGAGNIGISRKNQDSNKQADEEDFAATSPGAGDSRIIGGVNPDDEIDWTDVVDDGTKDADAASG